MKLNYVLLGIVGLLCFFYCMNNSSQEGQVNRKKTNFILDTDIMRKFGDGCCRHQGSSDGAKDKGYRTIPDCLNLCETDPNCWAVDYKNPRGDKYSCTTYTGDEEPVDLHVECDKRTQCFKKVITGSAVCTVPQKCPVPPKEQKKLSSVVDSEEFEDKNENELKILDQIQTGLKEIVGLAVPPSACKDDPLACRPGALTEDQFAQWLKAESELTKETCKEPNPSDKCLSRSNYPVEKKLTEKEISQVLLSRCEKQIAPRMADPPNFKVEPQKVQKVEKVEPQGPPTDKNLYSDHQHSGLGPASYPNRQDSNIYASPDHKYSGPASNIYASPDHKHSGPASNIYASPDHKHSGLGPASNIYASPDHKHSGLGPVIHSVASQPGAGSASDGNWESVPSKNNNPLNGQNMYRELSSPAFSGNQGKKYVSLFG